MLLEAPLQQVLWIKGMPLPLTPHSRDKWRLSAAFWFSWRCPLIEIIGNFFSEPSFSPFGFALYLASDISLRKDETELHKERPLFE